MAVAFGRQHRCGDGCSREVAWIGHVGTAVAFAGGLASIATGTTFGLRRKHHHVPPTYVLTPSLTGLHLRF